jgi:hypothetical protein
VNLPARFVGLPAYPALTGADTLETSAWLSAVELCVALQRGDTCTRSNTCHSAHELWS